MNSLLLQAFIYLCAAVITVPIAKRLGFSSVLGYLVAGIVIGPALGLVGSETQDIQQFAEFGIVMMLFVVGLGLKPRRLWEMRSQLLGLGSMQVGITALLIAAAAHLIEVTWGTSIAIGMILALSSTAIVLQTLGEKGLADTKGGRASFSILLFQDIAVIPILALIPLLVLLIPGGDGPGNLGVGTDAHGKVQHQEYLSLIQGLSGWAQTLGILLAVAAVLLGERYVARPLFRMIAKSKLREILTAAALLLVIGTALLMTLVGMSPALGVFLAGVLLANSEYRYELESVIEPFKGLLLGLFFITVGAGIDFRVLFSEPATVLGLTLGVMVLKAAVLFGLGHLFGLKSGDRWLLALALAQAGEFSFVLLAFSVQNGVVPDDISRILLLVIALTMLLAPLLMMLSERLMGSDRLGGDSSKNLRVFISYSRKDISQTKHLLEVLEREGFEVFVDFRDLPYGEEWQRELDQSIRKSDIVVWMVSSDSLKSKWCDWEIGKVTEYAKRLIPVMVEDLDRNHLPEAINRIQVIPRAGIFDFGDSNLIDDFIETLRTSHTWIKQYTVLMERAVLWNKDGRSSYWLLREDELSIAKTWLNEAPDYRQRLNETVMDLIHSSEITRQRK